MLRGVLPRRLFLGRLLLVVGSSLVSITAVELLARWSEGVRWWDAVREEQAANQALEYRRNAAGLRDEDYAVPRAETTWRLTVFGDSFTFGIGVTAEDAVFCELLERAFRARPPVPGYEHFEVLNAGIPGSLTQQWVHLDERITAAFDPQAVLAVFFLRDGTDLTLRNDFFAPVREGLKDWESSSILARHSALWRRVRSRRLAREMSSSYRDAFQAAYFGTQEQRAEWNRAQSNLRTLKERCDTAGRAFHLVIFPVLFGLQDDPYPFAAICQEVERFAHEAGIPALSLLPAFRGQTDAELWISAFDQHPNAKGHLIAAAALEAYLRGQLGR